MTDLLIREEFDLHPGRVAGRMPPMTPTRDFYFGYWFSFTPSGRGAGGGFEQ